MNKKPKPYAQLEPSDAFIASEPVVEYRRSSSIPKAAAISKPVPDSKEYIVSGLKDAFRELKKIKSGKSKTYSLEEVLKEMRQEAESND